MSFDDQLFPWWIASAIVWVVVVLAKLAAHKMETKMSLAWLLLAPYPILLKLAFMAWEWMEWVKVLWPKA